MATLTVTIEEELTINGKQRGNTNSISISSVSEVYSRVLTIGNAEQSILDFQATNPSGSAIADGTLQYLRITNLDTGSDTVDLRLQSTDANKEFLVRIAPSESFVLFHDQLDVNATSSDLDGAISLSQIDVIKADCTGSASEAADVEIFAVAT